MNYKGKLSEWCSKQKLNCSYDLVSSYGQPHDMSYIFSVTVNEKTVLGEVPKKRIKDAQQEAARVYIETVSYEKTEPPFLIDPNTCYYIDLENCADIDLSHFTWYHTFASEAASKRVVERATILTSCTRSDAADVALITQLVEDVVNNLYDNYAVVSRDRLLLTAVEVIKDKYVVDIKAVYP